MEQIEKETKCMETTHNKRRQNKQREKETECDKTKQNKYTVIKKNRVKQWN